jgi:hypothetical protein
MFLALFAMDVPLWQNQFDLQMKGRRQKKMKDDVIGF